MMVVGLCLGWAIGAAAMRAALAARNQVLLRQSLQQEVQRCGRPFRLRHFTNPNYQALSSVAGLANPDALFIADIFEGKFLDTACALFDYPYLRFDSRGFVQIVRRLWRLPWRRNLHLRPNPGLCPQAYASKHLCHCRC